jgi:hypothetical protein
MTEDFVFVSRTRVLDYDDYVFDIDEYRRGDEQRLTAHIAFENFNKQILKRVLHEWKIFRQCVTAPLFAYCGGYDTDKWVAFVSLLGFRPTDDFMTCNNGERRQIFIHTVTNDHKQTNNPIVVTDGTVGTTGGRTR